MKIEGKIQKVHFFRDGWSSVTVTDVFTHTGGTRRPMMLKRGTLLAAGNISNPVIGTKVFMDGDIVIDKKYGKQFKVIASEIDKTDVNSIISFLSSGFIKGVGESMANTIVSRFGKNTFDIIAKEPMRLTEIPRIGKVKALAIHESYKENTKYVELMDYFNGQITMTKVKTIYELYGKKAVEIIKKNPYQLIYDIRGFGFKIVDKLAISSGIKLNDPRRVKAGIIYSLETASQNSGHCYIDIDEVSSNVKSIITNITVEDEVIVDQVVELINEKYLVCEDDSRLYLKGLYRAEVSLAEKLSLLKNKLTPPSYDDYKVNRCIEDVECSECIDLEYFQKEAIKTSLKNHVSIITGGPGTGKTTIINVVVKSADEMGIPIILLAPTGRAARKLAESTGMAASTIAKFNLINNKVIHHGTLFVVDETSMVDITTAAELFSHIHESCTVVLVGDIDQLPPIGPGNFFRDLVNSKAIPLTKLKYTHRFGGAIAKNADAINRGNAKIEEAEDFEYIKTSDSSDRQKLVLDAYYDAVEEAGGDVKQVQIIVPMRQRGDTCANTLNQIIRERMNPQKPRRPVFLSNNGFAFRVGDRVMQTQNDPVLKINNGDCGIVTDITGDVMEVLMDVGGIVNFEKHNSGDLVIAYAITVHKSQGSEYDTVISAYGSSDYVMLQRNLLYTAVTRAKRKMILIADPKSIYRSVNNIQPIKRNTTLVERIK